MYDFAIPDHVSPALVFAFDMFAREGVSEDPQLAWLRLRAVAPEIF